jgi:hypothetical protein
VLIFGSQSFNEHPLCAKTGPSSNVVFEPKRTWNFSHVKGGVSKRVVRRRRSVVRLSRQVLAFLALLGAKSPGIGLPGWPALTRFLEDGRVELDNNGVERAIRPIALGRKNHLFAGSDGGAARWAVVASLLATAKLNDVEPFAYLKDVLERMSTGHPMSKLDDLLPWNWTPSSAKA